MLNALDAIGYANEKVHTGMIEYLCDLFNAGIKEPLRLFFQAIDRSVTFEDDVKLEVKKEFFDADLVIAKRHPDDSLDYYIVIEMKVDQHEAGNNSPFQTERYYDTIHRQYPEINHYFYFTLGMGEYFGKPKAEHFTWVRLSDCFRAIDRIGEADLFISCWFAGILRERDFRLYCQGHEFDLFRQYLGSNRSRKTMWEKRGWNLCFLGELKCMTEEMLPGGKIRERNLAVYMSGTDTILNFDDKQQNADGSYIEINMNGTLNLKVNKAQDDKRPVDIAKVIKIYPFEELGDGIEKVFELPENQIKGFKSKTKTVKRYNIGIEIREGRMVFADGETWISVAERLAKITTRFACWGEELIQPISSVDAATAQADLDAVIAMLHLE